MKAPKPPPDNTRLYSCTSNAVLHQTHFSSATYGMFDPDAQLQNDLRESIKAALLANRPILTHLSADSTWLLQLPHHTASSGRSRFNVLIDPWLTGPQSDVARFFSTQWHAIASSVQSIADLNQHLQEVELLNCELQPPKKRRRRSQPRSTTIAQTSFIDVVVISHEFTDHCHKDTLLEIDSTIPIVASQKAADLIKSWNHFLAVYYAPPFAHRTDWRSTSIPSLPTWLGISRIVTESDALYYHSAILITFQKPEVEELSQGPQGCAEAIIYTPHGVHADDLGSLGDASPPIRALALLHGLHDVSISLTKQLNLGAHNGLKAQRLVRAKYWVGTHDEEKIGGGLVARFLRRRIISIQDALDQEKQRTQDPRKAAELAETAYVDLSNGESLLLE